MVFIEIHTTNTNYGTNSPIQSIHRQVSRPAERQRTVHVRVSGFLLLGSDNETDGIAGPTT